MSNLISIERVEAMQPRKKNVAHGTPEPGHNSWERWRLAGEFRFSVPGWPAGRRRSQEVHGNGVGPLQSLFSCIRAGAGLLAFACLLCGCISRSPYPVFPLDGTPAQGAEQTTRQNLASIFPAQYRSVQRAILTVAGKQFTCDGVLEVSTNAGWHLAIVSNLGLVAGLRVNRDGSCEVLQATSLFREAWTRQFVARDVRRLFIPPPEFVSAGRLADGRLVCKTAPESDGAVARYVFSADGRQWQELNVWRGGRCEYHAEFRGYRVFAGTAREAPAEMEVQAEGYQLHLRLVELNPKDSIAPEAAR